MFFGLVALTAGLGITMMVDILQANGMTAIEGAILALFAVTFGWIVVAFWTAVAGFVLRAAGLDPIGLTRQRRPRLTPPHEITTRTAILLPTHNEDPAEVFAMLAGTYRSLERTGQIDKFDFFILSDSTDGRTATAEEAGWAALRRELDAEDRLFYRRRDHNTGRKAGNIADFCRRWGRHYEFMIVLDADSLMTGSAIVRLVGMAQATPDAGIIQTTPMLVRQETVFGRFAQFAARIHGPVLATGMSFWQMGEGTYWGHNAIIRVAAFTACCGLPILPGRPPLGGEIHSHDFVEAALLRRRGWRVYIVPDVDGSYEGVPGNLLSFAKRDRRWAQGNLQHLKLFAAQGLHPLSRLHFTLGSLAYISSLIWLLFLVLSTVDAFGHALGTHDFFSAGYQLFPNWHVVRYETIVALLTLTIALLLLPKILSLILVLADGHERRKFGGTVCLLASTVAEIAFAMLLAPLMMLLHAYFVVAILAGRCVAWTTQDRDNERLDMASACRCLLIPSFVGVIWGGATYAIAPNFFWWLTPIVVGLVLSIPIAVYSSCPELGRRARGLGLFLTPEEVHPPAELDVNIATHGLASPQALAATAHTGAPPTPPEVITDMPAQRLNATPDLPPPRAARPPYRKAPQ